jgi:hypothetical protein
MCGVSRASRSWAKTDCATSRLSCLSRLSLSGELPLVDVQLEILQDSSCLSSLPLDEVEYGLALARVRVLPVNPSGDLLREDLVDAKIKGPLARWRSNLFALRWSKFGWSMLAFLQLLPQPISVSKQEMNLLRLMALA